MNWSTPRDLKRQLMRRWERGELLRSLVGSESDAPIRLLLKAPTSSDLTQHFEAVRSWAAALAAMPHVRIEWREVRHRVHGLQRLPARIWVDTLGDAFALLGKRPDADVLMNLLTLTRSEVPALLPWIAKRPLQAITYIDQWPRLLAVVRWLVQQPWPRVYLRQVDLAGVHSKFIEAHRAVLSELLDLALPPEAIDASHNGIVGFAARYGFLGKPARIRFRVLDERLRLLPSSTPYPDITLDADTFADLDIPVQRVFITENEINFLAFPSSLEAIVIFGAGYGWDALARAKWLARCSVHYWGDIDTHGFAILDQLRTHFGKVSSLLMDRETLTAHEQHLCEEPEQVLHDLPRLLADEQALFDDLRYNRLRRNLRLEQERISYQWLCRALATLTVGNVQATVSLRHESA